MKKKIDLFWYWFIFVVAFVLCFFVVNDKKVNAYELDSNGNLVSDNLYTNNYTECGYSYLTNCSIQSNNIYIDVEAVAPNGYTIITKDIRSLLDIGVEYTFTLFTENDNDYFWFRLFNSNNTDYQGANSFNKSITYTFNDNMPLYLAVYTSNQTQSYTITGIMITKGSVIPSMYVPGGVWYSQSNYDIAIDNAYQSGYDDGYDDGYVDNNSIPTIYLEEAVVYYYVTNVINGGTSTMVQDVTSSISNLNATLNFNSFINLNWGTLVKDNQVFSLSIDTLTPIGINDVLRFSFNDISNSSKFSSKFSITFGNITSCGTDLVNCHSIVTLNYEDISNADFEVVLSNFDNSLSVTEFTHISINFYRENGFMYGITELIDTSLLSDVDTQYDIGYKVGYINGNDAGLVEGEKIGYDKGYSVGYRKASQIVSDPGNNTLVGLVSVVMGMPVNMLMSIYNFEFLGINLASFILSLVTCIVIIWLIKKFL